MEDGLNGLSGLHAVLPVVEELVKEAESVATHRRNLAGETAPVSALTRGTAMNMIVLFLVSLLANGVLEISSIAYSAFLE